MKTKSVQPVASFVTSGICNLKRTGLEINKNPSFDVWVTIGESLRSLGGGVLWWIGDWLNYGEKNYGSKYTQVMASTDYDYQTLRDAKWLSSKIELSRRRDNLSWSHHQEVAALEPTEQDKLLSDAEANGWTRNQLRTKIRETKHPPNDAPSEDKQIEALQRAFNKLSPEGRSAFLQWAERQSDTP